MLYHDAHLHLQSPELAPHLPQIVKDLRALPLAAAVVNGTTEADWPAVHALTREHPWVIPSYGLHPWYLDQHTPQWHEILEALLAESPSAAVGEIGLDRWMRNPDPPLQRTLFLEQLRLATRYHRPATIHCLRAWGTLLDLLHTEPLPAPGFLLHAYGGPVEMVDEFAQLGAYFSFSGTFLAPGREKKLLPFRRIPPERLLLETDAPAMLPPASLIRYPLPNGTNHPANLAAVQTALAHWLGQPEADLAHQLAANFHRLFGALQKPERK